MARAKKRRGGRRKGHKLSAAHKKKMMAGLRKWRRSHGVKAKARRRRVSRARVAHQRVIPVGISKTYYPSSHQTMLGFPNPRRKSRKGKKRRRVVHHGKSLAKRVTRLEKHVKKHDRQIHHVTKGIHSLVRRAHGLPARKR